MKRLARYSGLVIAASWMLSLFMIQPAFAATEYMVTWLGLLDDNGNGSYATGINNSGKVSGWSGQIDNNIITWSRAFSWERSLGMTNLGTLGGDSAQAWDLNDNGQVVGWAHGPYIPRQQNSYEFAFMHDGTAMTGVLGTIAGHPSWAYGINNNGKVAGYRWMYTGAGAFLYDGTTVQELVGMGYPYDINDSDVVVGTGAGSHAVKWENGQITDLGTIGGGSYSWAWAINNSGEVVGTSEDAARIRHPFLYSNGIMTDLGANGEARGINNLGHVVGYLNGWPFLYKNGVLYNNLNDLIPPVSGILYSAIDINDQGYIAGHGLYNNVRQAYVLTPIADTANLSISQTDSPDPITVGNKLTYKINVVNNGPAAATNVVMTDTLPADVTFVSALSSQGSCINATAIICELGTMANGATATITIVVKPKVAGTINNNVSVSGSESDPVLTNNTSITPTTVKAATVSTSTDLKVTMSDEPDPAKVGESLVYKILISNIGTGAASNVKLTDVLPAGVTFLLSESAGVCSGTSTIICNFASLGAGGTAEIKILVKPLSAGIINNTVNITSSTTDTNTTNNSASTITTVQ